jgi:uncharacterized protein (DUF1330 family)
MKAYWITLCQVNDEEGYGEYIKLAGPAIEKFGGKFLARGGKQHKLEGDSYERTVIVQFDSLEIAKEAYESDQYKEALKFSSQSADRHVVVVEAL